MFPLPENQQDEGRVRAKQDYSLKTEVVLGPNSVLVARQSPLKKPPPRERFGMRARVGPFGDTFGFFLSSLQWGYSGSISH